MVTITVYNVVQHFLTMRPRLHADCMMEV